VDISREEAMMVKWSGSKDRYDLPNDPGLITRAYWWAEDAWRRLDAWDRHNVKLMVLGLALAGFLFLWRS